jgi:hypothetical protein
MLIAIQFILCSYICYTIEKKLKIEFYESYYLKDTNERFYKFYKEDIPFPMIFVKKSKDDQLIFFNSNKSFNDKFELDLIGEDTDEALKNFQIINENLSIEKNISFKKLTLNFLHDIN